MKKLLISSVIFGSLAIVVPSASAAPAAAAVSADPQIRVQLGDRRGRRAWNRGRTTRTYTRIVGYGRNRVRETVRVTYLPNGRTRTTVISRTRIGRNW